MRARGGGKAGGDLGATKVSAALAALQYNFKFSRGVEQSGSSLGS